MVVESVVWWWWYGKEKGELNRLAVHIWTVCAYQMTSSKGQ